MRNLPIDSNKITLIGTGKTAERAEYVEMSDGSRKRSGNQARAVGEDGKAGAPLWVVDCLLNDPDAQRAEIVSVKIASYEIPETTFGQPVRFVGLTAMPYVAQGSNRVALSFTAEGMEGAGQVRAPKDAA